jgi:hypothetical protein
MLIVSMSRDDSRWALEIQTGEFAYVHILRAHVRFDGTKQSAHPQLRIDFMLGVMFYKTRGKKSLGLSDDKPRWENCGENRTHYSRPDLRTRRYSIRANPSICVDLHRDGDTLQDSCRKSRVFQIS